MMNSLIYVINISHLQKQHILSTIVVTGSDNQSRKEEIEAQVEQEIQKLTLRGPKLQVLSVYTVKLQIPHTMVHSNWWYLRNNFQHFKLEWCIGAWGWWIFERRPCFHMSCFFIFGFLLLTNCYFRITSVRFWYTGCDSCKQLHS